MTINPHNPAAHRDQSPSLEGVVAEVARALDQNVRLLVLSTNVTQNQFEAQFPGIRDSLAQIAAHAVIEYQRHGAPNTLSIIGRERFLIDKLTKVMHDAAIGWHREHVGRLRRHHHNYSSVVETTRGSTFTVQILVDGEPADRVARVTVELLAEA